MSLFSIVVVFLVMTLIVGLSPLSWGETLGYTLLCMVLFLSAGVLLGTLLKHRLPVMVLSIGISIPLFFVSGAFGPISFSTLAIQILARIFPLYYVIVLQQHAFHGFVLNTYGLSGNILILCGYTLGLMILAALLLRRSTTAH
jgi:ABC-2 type transport system permease protein